MSAIDANFPLSLPSILWVAEWGGSLLAIGGALVMSMNRSWSWCAWPIWIFSNLLLVAPTALSEHWGMVVMQVAFVVMNVNGLATVNRRRGDHRRVPADRGNLGDGP